MSFLELCLLSHDFLGVDTTQATDNAAPVHSKANTVPISVALNLPRTHVRRYACAGGEYKVKTVSDWPVLVRRMPLAAISQAPMGDFAFPLYKPC